MTLFDIFYKHTKWWYDVPEDGGKDTYHYIIEEMEACASEYAKELRGIGDKWLQVLERETNELCRPNHYSYPLHGEKKEWHDFVREDFLCHIRKVMEHYNGCDFCELPDYLLPFYGIYGMKKKKRVPEPQQVLPDNIFIPLWCDDGKVENQVPSDIKKVFNTKANHDNFIKYCYSVQSKDKPYIWMVKKFAEIRFKDTEEKTDKQHTGATCIFNYLSLKDKDGENQPAPHLDLLKCSYRTWSRFYSANVID